MLRAALGGLVAVPLTQIRTVDQMMTQQQNRPRSASEVPPEIQTKLVHATLDKQYRALLEQPVPMLGNLTPRAAARTRSAERSLPSGSNILKTARGSLRRPIQWQPMTSPGCGGS
jgi:hypothetical protein